MVRPTGLVEEAVMGDGSAGDIIELGAGMLIPLEAEGGGIAIVGYEAWDVVGDRVGGMAGETAQLAGLDLTGLVTGLDLTGADVTGLVTGVDLTGLVTGLVLSIEAFEIACTPWASQQG